MVCGVDRTQASAECAKVIYFSLHLSHRARTWLGCIHALYVVGYMGILSDTYNSGLLMCNRKGHAQPQFYISGKRPTLIARFMGPIWGPPGYDRTQVGSMLAT